MFQANNENGSIASPSTVKKARIRKACDSCNVKRTKCDGNHPCAHCLQVKIECTYLRQEKRRGRASEKYPKDIKKRKTKTSPKTEDLQSSPASVFSGNGSSSGGVTSGGSVGSSGVGIPSKKPDASLITHRSNSTSNGFSFTPPQISPTSSDYSLPKDFDLGTPKYPILENIRDDLTIIGLPYHVADDLFEFYFDEFYPPASKVFSILRHCTMLENKRKTQPNLLLAIMLSSAVQIDNRFFAGSTRAYVCKKMYELIQEKLPTNIKSATLDDFIVVVHLGFFMPWLSYPIDSVYWWEFGYELGLELKLLSDDPRDSEEVKEEKRRAWWGLYILDRLTAICFNKDVVIQDDECLDVYLPGDESQWVHYTDPIRPAELNLTRVKSVRFDQVSDGIYGWFLPLAKLMGAFVQYKSICQNGVDDSKKFALKNQLIASANANLEAISKNELVAYTAGCPEKEKSYSLDMCCAKYINLVLGFVLEDIEGWEVLGDLDKSPSEAQYQRLAQCIQILEEILKLDEDLHRYPFLISFFLFLLGVSILSILNDIRSADHTNVTKINRFKYYVKVLVRCMEAVMITFPSDFLKMVRSQLIWSIKDCENLILLTDYIEKFKDNARKRKDALRAYSWAEGGRGIAI